MEITISVFWAILTMCFIYLMYQLARNKKVFDIRNGWINKNSYKWDKYTYDFMINPSLKNWFGLKFPKESDFK